MDFITPICSSTPVERRELLKGGGDIVTKLDSKVNEYHQKLTDIVAEFDKKQPKSKPKSLTTEVIETTEKKIYKLCAPCAL